MGTREIRAPQSLTGPFCGANAYATIVRFCWRGSRLDVTANPILAVEKSGGVIRIAYHLRTPFRETRGVPGSPLTAFGNALYVEYTVE